MPYISGGVAFGTVKVSTPTGSDRDTSTGWTVGAGVEYAFCDKWLAKLEYLYLDSATCSAATCGLATDANVNFTANIVRAGLNYRF